MHLRVLALLAAFLVALPPAPRAQQQSLGEVARRAREQKKHAPKASKVFTNDNLPRDEDNLSVVGLPPAEAAETENTAKESKETTGAKQQKKGEAYWRKRFADAREKLQQAEKELDLLQRELNFLEMQYYSNPNEALQQQYSRSDINQKRQKIEEKQKEMQQLRQALSDLRDELRRAGGDPGWAEGTK